LITESFLNSCFSIILNKESRVKKTKMLYRDILDILKFTEERETVKVPVVIQSKLDCLRKICELLLTDKTIESVLDSIAFSERFTQYREFLDLKINEILKEHVFQDIVKQIRLRKKINALFKNYDELNKVLESIKDGSFDSIDDLVEDYEVTIKTLYSNMMESNRSTAIEATASLDLTKDDFKHVIEMIQRKYDRSNKTPTGFPLLDNEVLLGGYEPSRLYVWGGGSGSGKSTILNNSIIKSAIIDPSVMSQAVDLKPGEVSRVYIYVTMENTIEEALMRTYMPLFDRTIVQMLSDIKNGVDIRKKITDKLTSSGTAIIMKYFPPMSIGALDLMAVVDEVIETYGNDKIAGLYIDYLDLLKTDTSKYDIYRLELGQITLSLKTLAVQYNIPVITGTQLGRSAYKIQESSSLSVDQISESIKKVEHADFVALLAKDPVDDKIVHGKIGKNRSGKSNLSLDFKVDFSLFKFLSVNKTSNKDKADCTTNLDTGAFKGMQSTL